MTFSDLDFTDSERHTRMQMRFPSLRYLYYSLLDPKSRRLGYTRMGMGIEERFFHFSAHWRSHLEHSLSAQEEWLKQIMQLSGTPCENLLILGAGRLFDANLANLSRCFAHIHLIDADRACVAWWKKAARIYPAELSWRIAEISGHHELWLQTLELNLRLLPSTEKFWPEALSFFGNLELLPAAKNSVSNSLNLSHKPQAVISLNMLSQIAVMWQDSACAALSRHFGRNFVVDREKQWVSAWAKSAKQLLIRHLEDLKNLSASNLLLITDLDYLYYKGCPFFAADTYAPPPVSWENHSWQRVESYPNENISCEQSDALWGLSLEDPRTLERLFPGYDSTLLDCWLWHICPQGAEDLGNKNSEIGTIHRVGAFALRKS